jgi:hypothetical protein
MVIEMVFNNKIQIFFFQVTLHFWEGKNIIVYIIEETLNLVIWTK